MVHKKVRKGDALKGDRLIPSHKNRKSGQKRTGSKKASERNYKNLHPAKLNFSPECAGKPTVREMAYPFFDQYLDRSIESWGLGDGDLDKLEAESFAEVLREEREEDLAALLSSMRPKRGIPLTRKEMKIAASHLDKKTLARIKKGRR